MKKECHKIIQFIYSAWPRICSISVIIVLLVFSSCKKEWLDVRSDKSLVVPTTLSDLQALLDYDNTMNSSSPNLGEIGNDDYYLKFADWNAQSPVLRSAYIWDNDINTLNTTGDWTNCYKQIYVANVVLDGLKSYKPSNDQQSIYNNVKGSALFYRANAMYNLAQVYAQPYNTETVDQPGIVLKENSDVLELYRRATVKETYDLIIRNLQEAQTLLPSTPLFLTRPSKRAVEALLARIYLSMEDYIQAGQHANAALEANSSLIDFNKLTTTASFPIMRFNDEVIFHHTMAMPNLFLSPRRQIDALLYQSFNSNDIRKTAFFNTSSGNVTFKGFYSGNSIYFSGLANDEMFLIRAECFAREDNVAASMSDLNTLLQTRWKTGTFIPLFAKTKEEALELVLLERRKELQTRGIRWSDLRRLNRSSKYQITIHRELNGTVYSLFPGDNRYVWPIPESEITIMGLVQNPRGDSNSNN